MSDQPQSPGRSHILPVILCGGTGTRLWPLSREIHPKPFIKFGRGNTLFRNTVERARKLNASTNPVIVCNGEYRFYVLETLEQCGASGTIILEPAPRNTAPAIALAALAAMENGEDPVLAILPSDHAILDNDSFVQSMSHALPLAQSGWLVIFGAIPDAPDSGYGYIKTGEALDANGFKVSHFVEKPDAAGAAQLLATGEYFWNCGIFLTLASTYLSQLAEFSPQIHASCLKAWEKHQPDGHFLRPDKALFLETPPNSIDYAILEHSPKVAMVPLKAGWRDMGSWQAFYAAGESDASGNVCQGDVIVNDVENCYLHAESRLIAGVGLRDLAIIESGDSVLVIPRKRAQEVKHIVDALKTRNRKEAQSHPLVYRPWGSYETLVMANRFQVKRIIVKPGASLSLQMHHHRSEHWVVVKGTAEVRIGDETRLFTENQSSYIPLGSLHKLANPGIIPLEIIEIQSGSYLGEDDIVRFADKYGRE